MTTIPCKPKSCGDNNRANTIIVAVCTTNFAPCAETAATPPTTDFRLRSATDGCAERDDARTNPRSNVFEDKAVLLVQSLA